MNSTDAKEWDTSNTFSYTIPGLDIEHQGHFLFTYISSFLAAITPYDLPLDLVRDGLHANLTVVDFATKSLRIESGFIVLAVVFVMLAFVPLCATFAWCCHRKTDSETSHRRHEEPINPLMLLDDTMEKGIYCRRRVSIIVLAIFFVILLFSDVLIFVTNSQLSSTIDMAPELIQASVHDMKVFLKDTHNQIKYKLDNGFDISIERAVKDLNDIDVLLGEPIRLEVSASTGIELAFDSLTGISVANSELINRVQLLQETLNKAMKISQEAAARMEELQIQLSVLQRQCTFRDRPLCDTLRIRSFEENGIIDALKMLQEDQNIFRMKYLGELESDAQVKNLSSEVAISRSIFSNFPLQVKSDTINQRNETVEKLEQIKHKTTANAQLLTNTITSLLDQLTGSWERVEPHYNLLQKWSEKYWTLAWTTGMIVVWIVTFMALTFCMFLCNSNVKAAVIMVASVCLICLGSFAITFFGVISLTIGGNTEIFLCQPLFNGGTSSSSNDAANEYQFLGELFDQPGYIYENEPKNGIIGELLRPPGENKTFVDVELATAISDCELNKPSYTVFKLDAFVNTQHADTMKFPKVTAAINSIHVAEKTLLSLTQTIQVILNNMLQTSDFNSTLYRSSITHPTPEKDLATFIDQMQRVALQIQDVATSSRMTTLGSRAKRLQASILQPLEQLRNEILYHLTALELQKDPWTKQVNQTLNHLRNIQGYLERTAGEICENQTKIYVKRLKDYLSLDKDIVTSSLGDQTAVCRPLFDIFDANRNLLCRNGVDSLNGLWFCTLIVLLIWSIGTPISLNIITMHNRLNTIARTKRNNAHLDSEDKDWRTSRNKHESSSPRTPRRTPPRTPRRSARTPPLTTNRNKPRRPMRNDSVSSLSIRSLEVETGGAEQSNNGMMRTLSDQRNHNLREASITRAETNRNRDRDRDRDVREMRDIRNIRDGVSSREYRGVPRPPPAPPAPPAPPPPDYMNRTTTENMLSHWNWEGPSSSPRRDVRIFRAPPSPPSNQPIAPAYMNRQDSVRSVRWETSEDMVFEEVESGNPMMLRNS